MLAENYRRISKMKKSNEHHTFSFLNAVFQVSISTIYRILFNEFLCLVGNNVKELIRDMRRVMEPFTAPNLKVKLFFSRRIDRLIEFSMI